MKQKNRRLVWGFVGLLTVLVLAGMCISVSNAAAPTGTAVGSRVPDFTLADLNNQQYQLDSVIGKNRVTVVNFWATWCGPCRSEIPELVRFYSQYSQQKVALLAVNLQQKPAEVAKFAQKEGMKFPVLLDTSGRVGEIYKIYAIPTTFIIDGKGIIRHVFEGATNFDAIQSKVQAILKE